MIDRRSFVKLLFAAPAIKAIDMVSSNKKEEGEKLPKALLVDPYQVNLRDIVHRRHGLDPRLKGIKIIRLRRPSWGRGEPIRKIF